MQKVQRQAPEVWSATQTLARVNEAACSEDKTLKMPSKFEQVTYDPANLLDALRTEGAALLKIDLNNNQLGIIGMQLLAEALKENSCPRLVSLNVAENSIGDGGMGELAKALKTNACPQLADLDLRINGVSADGVQLLAGAFMGKACLQLSTLNLGNNSVGADGVKFIAEALKTEACPMLATLHLESNKIGPEGAQLLAEAVKEKACPLLTTLSLYRNDLGSEGIAFLAEALTAKACPALATLSLGGTFSGEAGMRLITDALRDQACPHLAVLFVWGNGIGNKGAELLAETLAQNVCPHLSTLNLSNNKLTVFPEALCGCKTLTDLNLSRNDIDKLPWSLLHMTSLKSLNIRGNPQLGVEQRLLGNQRQSSDLSELFGYLRDLYGGDQPAWRYSFKLVLAGPSMAGKTSTLDALRRGSDAQLADAATERTIGLDIRELVLHDSRARDGEPLRAAAYDAGGHPQYQELLQICLTAGALYLLLFDVARPVPVQSMIGWVNSIQACAPGSVVIVVGSHADEAPNLDMAERTCRRLLSQLQSALEQQRDSLRATLAQHEADLLPEGLDLDRWSHDRAAEPVSQHAEVQKLRTLLEHPLKLQDTAICVSAATQHNIAALRTRIADTLFDRNSFPEFARQQPRSYNKIQLMLQQLEEPTVHWRDLHKHVTSDVPVPAVDTELTVRVDAMPLAEVDGKAYRLYRFLLELGGEQVHGFSVRFSQAQEQHARLQRAGVLNKSGADVFPAYATDHLRDMLYDESNVSRRAEDLRSYYASILRPEVLTHPKAREILAFDHEMLIENYLEPYRLVQTDPSLLRRAVAYFRATGDVLYYDQSEELRNTVFLQPQWLVGELCCHLCVLNNPIQQLYLLNTTMHVSDVWKELVRHDLRAKVAELNVSTSLLPDGLSVALVQELGAQFVNRGILDERLLVWIWDEVTSDAGLIGQLLALCVHMNICSAWCPSADGGTQWLVPLRLPDDPLPLPEQWAADGGDAALPSSACSFVGRLLDFGSGGIPSGLVGQVMAHITVLASSTGEPLNWKSGMHARLVSTGHSRMAFVISIEADDHKLALRARVAVPDAHAVLLQAVSLFQADALWLISSKWPGCSVATYVALPGPMTEPAVRGPSITTCERRRQLGETDIEVKPGVRVPLPQLVDAQPVILSAEVKMQLSTLQFFSVLATSVNALRMSPAIRAFVACLEKAGDKALGGSYKDNMRWADRLEELHGGAAHSSGSIGTLSPASAEVAAVQAGQPRILALVAFLGEVYEQAIDIVASRQFGSVGMLCIHVLRGFDWLAPAVLCAAKEHNVVPVLPQAFELLPDIGLQLQPEPQAETEIEPEPELADTLDPVAPLVRNFEIKSMQNRRYDFFINHCQASGQDQCRSLCMLLQASGASVWYDMQVQDLTAEGMEEGVANSRCVLIFLSDDCFGRPFCNSEQRWGILYGCKFLGVVEKDTRHNPADFAKEKRRAPADLKHLLDEVEFIEYRRRDFEANAMVAELLRRAGFATSHEEGMSPSSEPMPKYE